jgi:hypothetical protein
VVVGNGSLCTHQSDAPHRPHPPSVQRSNAGNPPPHAHTRTPRAHACKKLVRYKHMDAHVCIHLCIAARAWVCFVLVWGAEGQGGAPHLAGAADGLHAHGHLHAAVNGGTNDDGGTCRRRYVSDLWRRRNGLQLDQRRVDRRRPRRRGRRSRQSPPEGASTSEGRRGRNRGGEERGGAKLRVRVVALCVCV